MFGNDRKDTLETPVTILQDEWEFSRVLDLYRVRKPLRCLEIGSYYGGTLFHWLKNAQKWSTIVSVDTQTACPGSRHLYPEWTPENVTLIDICGDSHNQETKDRVSSLGPFDWVFIDADHYYESVKEDFETYREMCTGILLLHDICTTPDPSIEVDRLWKEIQRQGYITQEIVANDNQLGIGVIYLENDSTHK
jgi:predicted O-methyltransferase YrrM